LLAEKILSDMKKYLLYICLLLVFPVSAQSLVSGVVQEQDDQEGLLPLAGVQVYWAGTSSITYTDMEGKFQLALDTLSGKLIFYYIGYKADTLLVNRAGYYEVKMVEEELRSLTEVTVEGRRIATDMDLQSSFNTKVMQEKELFKAACCNLSESFETNPSVDVNYSDGVSGAKQIQMLGLSGIYTQLTIENLPGTRGLASNYGLSYVPGTWVESIQVTKGIGSVANGYESIAGQINVELKKPDDSEKIYLNGYLNSMMRAEGNLNLATNISKRLSTALLTHVDWLGKKIDHNKDGFLDMPLSNQYSIVNRWKYSSPKGFQAQAGIKILSEDRTGGALSFVPATDKLTTNAYGLGLRTRRYEAFAKSGYVWQDKPYKSVGVMADVLQHESDNYFGRTTYSGKQQSVYANLIYQSIIKTTAHKFRTGLSYLYDRYDETLNTTAYQRTESVPGAFVEYTYSPQERLSIIAGFRSDYNSLFGWIHTPRLHARYSLTENTSIRIAAGRGQRTANIFAENMSLLATSRQLMIVPSPEGKAYGLSPEIAWNYGVNLLHEFKLLNRRGNVSLDYYRTDFQNQVVLDLDAHTHQAIFTNLDGVSFSNSFQAEVNYEFFKRFEARLAYRLFDVRTTYHGILMERPLISKHRFFINLAYETKNKWSFDYTFNWNGPKRLPNTLDNPVEYQKAAYSPSYITMNAQISKRVLKFLDAYIGVENLTNFIQKDIIIAGEQPFGPYFDSALVWGPVIGRMYYIGFRMKIK
jgi:outer membrane receptor for ferrienterochelin and colicins